MASVAVAIITLESIFFPSFLLNMPIHSFTPMDRTSMMTDTAWNFNSSGFCILRMESLKNVNPTCSTRKDTTSAAIYSILPWPKGCSSSAGLLAILTPTSPTMEEPASDRLLNASAMTETLCRKNPTAPLTTNKRTLQKMPTTLANTP